MSDETTHFLFLRRCALPKDFSEVKAESPALVLRRYSSEKNVLGAKSDGTAKKKGMDEAIKALPKVKEVYKLGFQDRELSFGSLDDKMRRQFTVNCAGERRVIVGLGEQNVLEAGISLLAPYGVPYLPGSAIKGLAAHYCHRVYGAKDPSLKIGGAAHKAIFGTTDEAGVVVFHDAWIRPEDAGASLVREVLAPHHQKYNQGQAAPTDYDSPVPVPFLTAQGTFEGYLTLDDECRDENGESVGKELLDFVAKIVLEALENDGIGAKTSSGYGIMIEKGKDFVMFLTEDEKKKVLAEKKLKDESQKRSSAKRGIPEINEICTLTRVGGKNKVPEFKLEGFDGVCVVKKAECEIAWKRYPKGTSGRFIYDGPNGDKLRFRMCEEEGKNNE